MSLCSSGLRCYGQLVVVRFAVKPTSSILSPRKTVDRKGGETDITTKGRHDPCVGILAVPVGEAMMARIIFCCIAGRWGGSGMNDAAALENSCLLAYISGHAPR
jgi:chorismate synthase